MVEPLGADVRDMLTVIYDALAVPAPASPEYGEAADRLLIDRAARVRGVIAATLDDPGLASLAAHARVARQVIAGGSPVTYPVRECEVPVPVDLADDEPAEPARALPQIAIACPTCDAKPGELCTSHGGTRVRRHNTHLARTNRWAVSEDGAQ